MAAPTSPEVWNRGLCWHTSRPAASSPVGGSVWAWWVPFLSPHSLLAVHDHFPQQQREEMPFPK